MDRGRTQQQQQQQYRNGFRINDNKKRRRDIGGRRIDKQSSKHKYPYWLPYSTYRAGETERFCRLDRFVNKTRCSHLLVHARFCFPFDNSESFAFPLMLRRDFYFSLHSMSAGLVNVVIFVVAIAAAATAAANANSLALSMLPATMGMLILWLQTMAKHHCRYYIFKFHRS